MGFLGQHPVIVRRPLASLRPEWLATGGRLRYQMGVEFDCPRHPPQADTDHRIRLWFRNPCDGESPAPPNVVDSELYPRLVRRMGSTLENLTLTPQGLEDLPIRVYGHWTGYVLEGVVYDSFTFGGAP